MFVFYVYCCRLCLIVSKLKSSFEFSLKKCSHSAVFLKIWKKSCSLKWVVMPYYFAHNRLPCWPHVPYYNTMDAWKSSMWNPINIPVWLLGSKLKRAESFCAQRGGILSGMRQNHARSCQVLFWTLWSNNHASLIFSPLIMQCNREEMSFMASWRWCFLPEYIQTNGNKRRLHLPVFGIRLSSVGLPLRARHQVVC